MGERDGAFTPGPWMTINNPNSNYGLEIHADVKVKAKRVICRVAGPDRAANARLIEAAPDLFDFAQWVADHGGENNQMEIFKRARAVIAAARTQGSE